jgi:hypothetical protein
MRLINIRTLEFHDFTLSEVPPYAILSHTWSDEEVSFQDMSLPLPQRTAKKGFLKIVKTCELALRDGLDFAWIDTCCIDKSSSAELTESINSMFRWYKSAKVCYVALEDFPQDVAPEEVFHRCRWFTRGWTLQELLAPRSVQFYDMSWNYRGSKLDFVQTISKITRVPTNLLEGRDDVQRYSVAEKMSWAASRQTTRVEDIGYCLLGIFDVNMPLIYGEGDKAFRRLQEEIVKRKSDLTIFAWESPNLENDGLGLLASSPDVFADSNGIVPFADDFLDFSVTNKGLFRPGDSVQRIASISRDGQLDRDIMRYLINLGTRGGAEGGIYLRKIGPNIFFRDGTLPLAGFGRNSIDQISLFDATDYYILLELAQNELSATHLYRRDAVRIAFHPGEAFVLRDAVPTKLWDATDGAFLRPKPYSWSRYPMVLATSIEYSLANSTIYIVVLCDYRRSDQRPTCKLVEQSHFQLEAQMIFSGKNRHESVYWADLELQAPSVLELSDCIDVKVGHLVFTISVSLVKENVNIDWVPVSMFSMSLHSRQRIHKANG